jgi:hypothetical protein
VLRVPLVAEAYPARPPARAPDDEPALRAARATGAEVVVTGLVGAFTRDDSREAGRLARWGVGAPDARSHVHVSVTLRVLDARDGSVIIETTAARDRIGRGTAAASRPERATQGFSFDPLLEQAVRDVLGDLARTLRERLDAYWQARVLLEGRGIYVLDAGSSRGLFTGERLDVWRSGIEVVDEDLVHVGNEARIGALMVVGFERHGRARARLVEGEARMGDSVRPCSGDGPPAVSLRR